MNIAKAAQLILALVPVISAAVKQVEAENTKPGNGKEKLQLALAIVKAVYDATNPEESFDGLASKVTSIIAALVTFYNSIGSFVKSVKAAA